MNLWLQAILKENYTPVRTKAEDWSFASEWKYHKETGQVKTWDWTPEERLQQFFIETRSSPEQIKGKLVLDAGCGNGMLTKAIGEAGAYAVGIDIQPYLPGDTSSTCFIRGDFDDPPFKSHSFDIIIANGSIHHTPNTLKSFVTLTTLVKPGGRFYVWVYSKPVGIRKVLVFFLDIARKFISRRSSKTQWYFVKIIAGMFYSLSRIRKGKNSSRSKEEIIINIYDSFTPRYRFYHTEKEVENWFVDSGFVEIKVTNKDNGYGFGIVGKSSVAKS